MITFIILYVNASLTNKKCETDCKVYVHDMLYSIYDEAPICKYE